MREIKFRAWDNVDMKMYYTGEEDNIHFYFDGTGIVAERFYNEEVCTPEGERDFYGNSEKLEHLKYLEYTGLKDKNGVEIYEGDILAFEDDKFVWSVEYDVCCFVANGGEYNQKEELIEFYDWKEESLDVVIIGNIYEHPHLLEKNQ